MNSFSDQVNNLSDQTRPLSLDEQQELILNSAEYKEAIELLNNPEIVEILRYFYDLHSTLEQKSSSNKAARPEFKIETFELYSSHAPDTSWATRQVYVGITCPPLCLGFCVGLERNTSKQVYRAGMGYFAQMSKHSYDHETGNISYSDDYVGLMCFNSFEELKNRLIVIAAKKKNGQKQNDLYYEGYQYFDEMEFITLAGIQRHLSLTRKPHGVGGPAQGIRLLNGLGKQN